MKTNVTVRSFNGKTKTKAFVELTLDDTLVIKGLTLVDGKNGLFLSFPSSKGKDGKFYNSVYSLKKDWTKLLEETAINKYNEITKNSEKSGGDFN